MKNRLVLFWGALLVLLLSGCATRNPMAFENDADRVTDASKPIFLMTATLKNSYKNWQPRLLVVHVEKPDAKETADRLNFLMDDKGRNETDTMTDGNTYLLRMELAPGQYEIRGLTSLSRSFPIQGMFFTPMHSPVESKGAGVFYLGHLSATVRERKGDEFKAGPSVPLIDQAVVGASGGTFDIEISDRFDSDEAVLRTKFPALADVAIQKAILPPFDRAKAQAWWEAH